MGCTSSAPNTIPLSANTADKSIQFEEDTNGSPSTGVDVADIDDEKITNQTKVLPTCDTTGQSVQLVRNKKSTNSLAIEKDIPANGHVIVSEDVEAPANAKDEVTIPKLELFMDKVFETNLLRVNGSDHKLNDLVKSNEESPPKEAKDESDNKTNTEEVNTKTESETTEDAENDENTEEGTDDAEASPTQSQSSRATRWEALADIGAELPPSLAVDPVTGQIYQIALPK